MTITEEHIKASLISAVEDKLRRRIQERVNQYQAEMDTLNRTKHELNEGRAKINNIISKLEREEVSVATKILMTLHRNYSHFSWKIRMTWNQTLPFWRTKKNR